MRCSRPADWLSGQRRSTPSLLPLHSKCISGLTQQIALQVALGGGRVHAAAGVGPTGGVTPGGQTAKCWLVGAGPGPVDYLTLKAAKLLQTADVVIYDELGSQEALELVRPDALRVYVGKRGGRESIKQHQIDQLLVEHCTKGGQVVRLKGGCPSVFSRVSSEMAALQAAGIPYELVPGISSALAAPLCAGFPLTHAQLGPSFTVLTGHDVDATDWAALVRSGVATLVLLMAGRGLAAIAGRLTAAGWEDDTPVVVVRSAGLPEQRVWRTTLGAVDEQWVAGAGPLSPCVVVIGRVAGTAGEQAAAEGDEAA